jgi:thiol:disulfide interchange protein DsbD
MKSILLLVCALASSASENPIAFSLAGNLPRPGQSSTIKLVAKVEPGWSLYALNQPEEGPKPTRIWLPEDQPYKLRAGLKAPSTKRKFDPNFNLEVEYYTGEVAFQLPVESSGAGRLRVNVQYQACNDQLCLPPRTVTVEK